MKKRLQFLIMLAAFIGVIFGLMKVNDWLQGEVLDLSKVPLEEPVKKEPVKKAERAKPKKRTGDVIRKTRLAPERTFEWSIFYQGGEEIARQKESKKGMVYDQTGEIPDGKVKFINETSRTYGVEYYRSNVRHGPAQTNYNDGQKKSETTYQYGRLLAFKEFFYDGTLKMEVDYSDARDFMDDRDAGDGKMYDRSGSLKYEWHMVNSDPKGYYRSYNRQGELTGALYFDEFGHEIKPKTAITEAGITPENDIVGE